MTNIVLIGGNGLIGREVTRQWAKRDSKAHFYVISRSGKNSLQDTHITNIKGDVTDYRSLKAQLPTRIDYIVDFVGRPEKDEDAFIQVNHKPAQVMRKMAEDYQAKGMGFIGGKTGPKTFVQGKAEIIESLKQSPIPLAVVEPTIVYGPERKDSLAKLVPIFKVLGVLVANLKPVPVSDVAKNLLDQLKIDGSMNSF